jgi:hypothetical protein
MTLRTILGSILDTDLDPIARALKQGIEFITLLIVAKAALFILFICLWNRRQTKRAKQKLLIRETDQ